MRERLAELEHDQWIAWSKNIAESEKINPERYRRWEKLWRPYAELTEPEKDQDREWADKVLTIHETRCPYKPRIDNDNGNEYAQVMALKDENARLRESLIGLAQGYFPEGKCWCRAAFYQELRMKHTKACDKARLVLEGK